MKILFTGLLLAAAIAQEKAAQDNPLLNIPYRVPFDKFQATHIKPAISQLLADAQERKKALIADNSPRTWDNTMGALERMTDKLSTSFRIVGHLEGVATNPEWRKAYNEMLPQVSAFTSSIGLDAGVAAKVKAYSETPEAKALTGPKKRALELTISGLRRAGAYLSDDKKKRLAEVNTELAKLSSKFGQNVLDATNAFELIVTDEKELDGLPESAKQAAAASAKRKSVAGYRFTLQAVSVIPVMTFANNAALREKLYRASTTLATRGANDNHPVMARTLELRAEKAKLLGYADFADFQTEERMAKSGAGVKKFLFSLEDKTRPYFDKENSELTAYRKSLESSAPSELKGWELGYYSEKMRQQLLKFDQEKMRPYFPVNRVVEGMFTLVNRIYGITVKEVSGVPAWHADVRYFEIRDADGTHLGSFYMDLFPRDNKRAGAWMSNVMAGGPKPDGKFEPHLGTVNCNFTMPVGDKPALLVHREVETLLHEFGHLLHLALSRVPVKQLAGVNVAWDFVELPSQIMENFAWERPVLDLIAAHYQTGEKLPEDMYQALLKTRTFRTGNGQMRQLSLGITDIMLHTDYKADDKNGTVSDYSRKLQQRFTPVSLEDDFDQISSFSHIFAGGYAAGYYSYKWSEVLDADAYSKFKQKGAFSREAGESFRRTILEKGNSEDASQLYRNYMGRDPDLKPLLERIGLAGGR